MAGVKRDELWRDEMNSVGDPYIGFEAFMSDMGTRYRRSVSQLYAYMGVAEKLLPFISFANLDKMGITKATELKRAASKINMALPESVIEAALKSETTAKEVRALLFESLNLGPDNRPTGTYFDFGGAVLSSEERAEFVEFIKVAKAVLDIPKAMPEWLQRKEIILWAAREFTATHAPEVYGEPEQEPPANG